MAKTLVGVFDHRSSADKALQELQAAGVPKDHLRSFDNTQAATAAEQAEGRSWTEKIADWFRSFSDDEDRVHAEHYAEAWRRGHHIVVADVKDDQVDSTTRILNKHGTVDLSRRAEQWKQTGYTGRFDPSAKPYTAEQRQRELATYQKAEAAAQQSATVPVVQEEMTVGKRVVQRGGVRIHSYVVEQPVEEIVRFREERVNVERRAANRPVKEGEGAFEERTIEVSATGEEPVVEKRSRVVEEIVVSKTAEDQERTVKETVRRKDVRVERDAGTPPVSQPGSRR